MTAKTEAFFIDAYRRYDYKGLRPRSISSAREHFASDNLLKACAVRNMGGESGTSRKRPGTTVQSNARRLAAHWLGGGLPQRLSFWLASKTKLMKNLSV